VLMIRRIRDLLYDQGFTISGARNKMQELLQVERDKKRNGDPVLDGVDAMDMDGDAMEIDVPALVEDDHLFKASMPLVLLRRELFEIRELLALLD